jgi:hypothetical protein
VALHCDFFSLFQIAIFRQQQSHRVNASLQRHRLKFWEDEKSVLEEGLATLDRVHNFYRDRLNQAEAHIAMGGISQAENNGASLEAMQVRVPPSVTWGRCYKNSSIRNLRIFVVS